MNSPIKWIVSLVVFSFSVFYTSSFVNASIVENFNGGFSNPDAWLVSNDTPGLEFTTTEIRLSKNSDRTFPYVRSSYPIINTEDNIIEVKLKFDSISPNFGGGFAITDVNPPLDKPLIYPSLFAKYTMFYVWQSVNSPYFHIVTFLCPSNDISCVEGEPIRIYETGSMDLSDHIIRIEKNELSYSLYLDDNLIFNSLPTTRVASHVWFGNPEKTDTTGAWSSFSIDYLRIYNSQEPIFPYLSQSNPLWGDLEYDSATSWAGADNDGIDRWGCALTSAAMVMQNYGVKSADNKLINPADLNDWLQDQDDGYVGLGLINWIAVSRYVSEQYIAGLSPTKLEYVRNYSPATPVLPSIFDIGGHFVVAHGEKDLNWLINDPNDIDKSELAMTTSLKSINRFLPSETDLSYMLFTLSSTASAVLKNELGEIVPLNWTDEYIDSAIGESRTPAIKTAMLPKPANGKYYLRVTQPEGSSGEAKVYLYDDQASEILPNTYELVEPLTGIQIEYESEVEKMRSSTQMDLTPPSTPLIISPLSGSYVNTLGLVLDWSDEDDPSMPVTYNYKSTNSAGKVYGPVSTGTRSFINAPNTPDSTYNWQVQACDSALNCSEWSSSILTVDSTKPSAPIIQQPSEGEYFRSTPITNKWSHATDNVGVDYYRIQYEYDDHHMFSGYPYRTTTSTSRNHIPSLSEQGGVSFRVQAIDKAGNESDWSSWRHYTYDATPPILIGPPTTVFLTNSPVQIWSWMAGSDSGSGVAGYSTRTYDKVSETYLSDWLWIGNVLGASTTLSEGVWSLELKARDYAGNESNSIMSNLVTVDLSAPDTPIHLSPVDNSVVNGNYLLSDWTDSLGASKYVYESYHDSEMKRLRWREEYSVSQKSASKVSESVFWWRVRALDLAGNESNWSPLSKVTIDNTKPKLETKTSFDGWYRVPQTSYFDFSDPHMQSGYLAPSCEIVGDGDAQTCSVVPNVCDQAGNCYTTRLFSNPAKIDTTKPLVTLSAWGSTIDGLASDNLSGVSKVELKILKPDQNEHTVQATGTANWSYTMSESPYGEYRVIVVAYDNAGNTSEEVTKTFTMSPPAQAQQTGSPAVEGASTGPSEEPAVVTQNLINTGTIAEDSDEVIPSPTLSPSEPPIGLVLGEMDDSTKQKNWWLIIGLVGVGAAIFAILLYLIKKI